MTKINLNLSDPVDRRMMGVNTKNEALQLLKELKVPVFNDIVNIQAINSAMSSTKKNDFLPG